MATKLSVPFARSYWVIPERFLAGYYLGSREPTKTRAKCRALLEHGIRHIVNLMEEHERNFKGEPFVPYEAQLSRVAREMNLQIELVRMPIRDRDVPPVQGMTNILDEIDQAINRGRGVYVHCWGGRGRTGTVVGCYMVRHAVAGRETALDLLARLRRDDPISHLPSPETRTQAKLVSSWSRGQ
ncbi:MAG: dual specificity protein phosphatase family protein [Deltaproteobacteria bacterium]|nr:MAG: dual specificity protein phosphatase family protein [Deltaproteobacteria bacterium]